MDFKLFVALNTAAKFCTVLIHEETDSMNILFILDKTLWKASVFGKTLLVLE